MSDVPFDVGLQPERTLLSWRRTCLSIAVAGLLVIRFGAERLGVGAVVAGLLSLVLALIAYLDASRRYRRVHHRLTSDQRPPSAGVVVTFAASAVAVFAVACMVWLVLSVGAGG